MSERPDPRVLVKERFGDVMKDLDVCSRCGKATSEPFSHLPMELGGGCIDHDDPSCPFCGGVSGCCRRWCELARVGR